MVRSGFSEGQHRGSVVILDPAGRARLTIGEVAEPIFPRSCNKPMQALGMLRAGLSLPDDADLALACASHSGEPVHMDRVLAILARHGLTEDDLGCPPAYPRHVATRDELITAAGGEPGGGERKAAMNCSGKHAAMLATCVQLGWPIDDYRDPKHPLQVEIARTIEELTGEPIAMTGVDGCGAPLLGFSLTGLARAFTALVTAPQGSRRRLIADAMRAHPYLVAGEDRQDTLLANAVPGLLVKAGAMGVHAMALPDGTSVAIKIDDGAAVPRAPVMVGALRALGIDTPELEDVGEPDVLGGGEPVGSIRLLPGVFDGLS